MPTSLKPLMSVITLVGLACGWPGVNARQQGVVGPRRGDRNLPCRKGHELGKTQRAIDRSRNQQAARCVWVCGLCSFKPGEFAADGFSIGPGSHPLAQTDGARRSDRSRPTIVARAVYAPYGKSRQPRRGERRGRHTRVQR